MSPPAPLRIAPQSHRPTGPIASADKKWVWANAVIDGKAVVVYSPQVPKPVAVRFWQGVPLGLMEGPDPDGELKAL